MECDTRKGRKNTQLISRRDFARSSVAILGASAVAHAVAAPDGTVTTEAAALKIEKSTEIATILDERYITDDDIRSVIANAEKTGRKLYKQDSDHFLSKLRIDQTYFYVEYSRSGESAYRIHAAWAHRFVIMREPY